MNDTKPTIDVIKKEIEDLQGRIQFLEQKKNTSENEKVDTEVTATETKTRLLPSLMVVALITMVLMTIYEVVKQLLHPDITIWQSHMITIFFSSIIAPIGAYVAIKKIEFLRQKALSELSKREKIEEKLRNSNEELEERVQKRTFEISATNEKLRTEINMRKQAEEELRNYAEQLLLSKDLLEEKAEELSVLNKQLKKSEENLKELNASKDKFFSILAHDLRSPFSSVLGLSEFLCKDAEKLKKSEIKAFISSIHKSSSTIYKLLENLLQWSQIQTGRMKFQPTTFRLNDLVNDINGLFGFSAEKKNIELSYKLEKDFYINADKNMINSVLRNLVSNAIKFTNAGGEVKIQVSEFNGNILLMVEDTGIGMPDNKIMTLFDIEATESCEGTECEKGTGLGLILCKEFVEKNGGNLWVESEVGVGSRFVFSLSAGNTLQEK